LLIPGHDTKLHPVMGLLFAISVFFENLKYSFSLIVIQDQIRSRVVTSGWAPPVNQIISSKRRLNSSPMQANQSMYDEPIGRWEIFLT